MDVPSDPLCPPGPRRDPTMIEVRDLYKCYWVGTVPYPALNGIDLRVRHGELIVLAGRSGSGKSTLLNVIGILEEADSGVLRVCGQEVRAWTPGGGPASACITWASYSRPTI